MPCRLEIAVVTRHRTPQPSTPGLALAAKAAKLIDPGQSVASPQYARKGSIAQNMALRDTESARPTALGTEQAYLDMLYSLLDRARERAERALVTTNASGAPGGTFRNWRMIPRT